MWKTINDLSIEHPEYVVKFEDFAIEKCLGSGGYGDVYLAKHKITGTVVALKKLMVTSNHLAPEDEKYWAREIDILSRTTSAFTLRLMGFSTQCPYCIATEYIPNGSLYSALRRKRGSPTLDGTELTIIACVCAMALKKLHDNNIIHRDIKSANILLDNDKLPHICDFGISKIIDTPDDVKNNVMTNSIGTPNWMAPELFAEANYSFSADVYSYGMMLYEMVARRDPYDGVNQFAIIGQIMQGKRPPIPSNCSSSVVNLINKCWAQNPEDRPELGDVINSFKKHRVSFPGCKYSVFDEVIKKMQINTEFKAPFMDFITPPGPRVSPTPSTSGFPVAQTMKPSSFPSISNLDYQSIIKNPLDPSYEKAVNVVLSKFDFISNVSIVLGNFQQTSVDLIVKILAIIQNNLQENKTNCEKFVNLMLYKYIPCNVEPCVPYFFSIIAILYKNAPLLVSEDLIWFTIRSSEVNQIAALEIIYNSMPSIPREQNVYIINCINNYYTLYTSSEACCLIISIYEFFLKKYKETQFAPKIFEVLRNYISTSKYERVIRDSYLLLTDIQKDKVPLNTHLLEMHLKCKELNDVAKTYINTYHEIINVTPKLLIRIIELCKIDQNAAELLVCFAQNKKREVLPAFIACSIYWLFSPNVPVSISMQILLILLNKEGGFIELSKIKRFPTYFRKVIETKSDDEISAIATIVSKIDFTPEFIEDANKARFVLAYFCAGWENHNKKAISCAIVTATKILKTTNMPDLINILPYTIIFMKSNCKSPELVKQCINLFTESVRFKEGKEALIKLNIQGVFEAMSFPLEIAQTVQNFLYLIL